MAEIDTVLAHLVKKDQAVPASASRITTTTTAAETIKEGGRRIGLGTPIMLAGRLFKRLTGIR